jgi:hypothetical protein
MKSRKFPSEHYFYWLAFAVALILRLYKLGAGPLGDVEASWALQALGQANGGTTVIGAQPAYVLLTSLLFSFVGKTNFVARVLPALAGSLLVWLPFYFRRWMSESAWLSRAGLVLAFGLAIDPGLVSISRQAGSLMPALAFTLLTLAAFYNQRMSWAGFFAGLALLCGPSFLQGLLILAITWALFRLLGRKAIASGPEVEGAEPNVETSPTLSIRRSIPAFALTLVLAGTLFLRVPQGLGGLADTLTTYFQAWITPSGVPALRLPASLAVYQPLVLLFAVAAFAHAWLAKQDVEQVTPAVLGLGLWAIVALLLSLLYSGRQVADLAWCLIPLWALAALEISRFWLPEADKTTRVVGVCLASVLMVMTIVGWLNLLALLRFQVNLALYWASIIAAFLLGLIAVLLAAAGWSRTAAWRGLVWALSILLALQLLSSGIGMSIVHLNGAQELWSRSPATGQADLLLTSLADLSIWNTGMRDQLEIIVLNGSPSLRWALHNFPSVCFEMALSATEAPAVVITPKGNEAPVLAQKYRGQDFVWGLYPGWQGAVPPDFLNWLAYRTAPLAQNQVILWARADMFPGGALGADEGSTAPASTAP